MRYEQRRTDAVRTVSADAARSAASAVRMRAENKKLPGKKPGVICWGTWTRTKNN